MNENSLPHSLHFIGVGGIGMSALAQMACSLGFHVTGSDRAVNNIENQRIFHALQNCGIKLYPQDGSVHQFEKPGALIYSTAIEEDNPDFVKCVSRTERIHRSVALEKLIHQQHNKHIVSVTGTCGKTTVSSWLADALVHLGDDTGFLGGGLVNSFISPWTAGNFREGKGKFFVLEADESDKSLLNYPTDSVLLMNIGTDHYGKDELVRVFRQFIVSGGSGVAVIEDQALRLIDPASIRSRRIVSFSKNCQSEKMISGVPVMRLDSYRISGGKALCSFDTQREIQLPVPGIHNAENALAVYSFLREMGYAASDSLDAVENFHGVWRRFDYAGSMFGKVPVYDDYAHNVEKIISCLSCLRSLISGRLYAVFQPHGFAPLKFMRNELFHSLESFLKQDDRFAMLPVYYAGGTTSFSPSSEEVIADYRKNSSGKEKSYCYFSSRNDVKQWLEKNAESGDGIVVMGARDNSLSMWANELALNGKTEC